MNDQPKDQIKPSNEKKKRSTKKDQIISLFLGGIDEVEEITKLTGTRSSYVASVLQQAGLIASYFDLYTTTKHPVNIYSKLFAGRLGFKDQETAHKSVSIIDKLYRQFEANADRSGQHHALIMALTMFNRARWSNKKIEAGIFRSWLLQCLEDVDLN